MKIEAGKYYRTRGGERVGPAKQDMDHGFADRGFVWRVGEYTYTDEGEVCWVPDEDDIVAEWGTPTPTTTDNPCVKTVTRRDVVPGRLLLADGARIEITKVSTGHSGTYVLIGGYAFTAAALREAATAFNEIADALDGAQQ